MSASSAQEYGARLAARQALAARIEKRHILIGNIRLALVVLTATGAWFSLHSGIFSPAWLLAPTIAFVFAVVYHAKVLRAQSHALRAIDVYREGLARIEDRWSGTGECGERFDIPEHVYASDLDLFGEDSLFQLLSRARTRMGEDALAKWLLAPSPAEVIKSRHAAIDELRDRLDFREDLAVLGEERKVGVHPDALSKWAIAPNQFDRHWLRWMAPVLAILAVASAVAWAAWGIASPFILTLVIESIINRVFAKRLEEIFFSTELAFANLDLFSALLERVESEEFSTPELRSLVQRLSTHHLEGSRAIARLRTIVQFIDSRHNMFVRLIDYPMMFSVHVALRAEAWRKAHGSAVRFWIEGLAEMEALVSLATYSYEHPEDVFPEFIDGPAAFDGVELGHPLLPTAICVRNSVHIGGDAMVLLVSGSNMSGKSTLLRTVGINTVLAMAGAPVRARRVRLTPLQTGASIRINDSLHKGNSRFYAEIKRLRQIYDLAGQQPPLLFLLDELLQGTNSNDRRTGAEGVVRALLERGAIGAISTHDLALTDIGASAKGGLRNMHFQDEIEDGKMKFDFKLQEGVVTRSNGLELMRSIGLKV
jgi:hypothetical protein